MKVEMPKIEEQRIVAHGANILEICNQMYLISNSNLDLKFCVPIGKDTPSHASRPAHRAHRPRSNAHTATVVPSCPY